MICWSVDVVGSTPGVFADYLVETAIPAGIELKQADMPLTFPPAIALKTKPHAVCLVPERRQGLTTEGGLDVVGQHNHLAPAIARFNDAGVRVSLFIEPSIEALDASRSIGAPVVELHTGAWCEAVAAGDGAFSTCIMRSAWRM